MQNIRQCRRCNKLFNYVASPYCPICLDEIDREYKLVRDYIYENPHEGIKGIAAATKVPEKTILQLLREGRLELDIEVSALKCERCGKAVEKGRFCSSCQAALSKELRSAQLSIETAVAKTKGATSSRGRHEEEKDGKEYGERMHSRNP